MGKARIGIIGNNENDCVTCDSTIGFGTGGQNNNGITCGNQDQTAIGYILVQSDSPCILMPVKATVDFSKAF